MGFVPTDICRHCKRMLIMSTDGQWLDNLGWYICPITKDQHYPTGIAD